MDTLQQRVDLAGIVVDLMDEKSAVSHIVEHANRRKKDRNIAPLSVVSANLDHIVQFGSGSRWHRSIGDSLTPTAPLHSIEGQDEKTHGNGMQWLTLLDGAPLVNQSLRLTGVQWPRLAGSDLIRPLLEHAEAEGLSVGFLGGQLLVQQQLAKAMKQDRPNLRVNGFWAPDRDTLQDPHASLDLAESINESQIDILVVGLGKPRQELWMASYGELTGASVLLAFGAVVDFLAGTVQRAPEWIRENGLEWAWRLAIEPRRLARRYLLNNPPGLAMIRRGGALQIQTPAFNPLEAVPPEIHLLPAERNAFTSEDEAAQVSVIVVTYNNADTIEQLIATLRQEATSHRLRVIVVDNDSHDETVQRASAHEDVIVVSSGANLGYAGGINLGRSYVGKCSAVLVLNPDLTVAPGAIEGMLRRQRISKAGIVVPRLLDSTQETYMSLRREPSVSRALGDALLGDSAQQRPGWASEIDYDPESYVHPHQIDWATGAAMLIDSELEQRLGPWDEQFFLYSEETDYFRRARDAGAAIWYEPNAVMTHHMGGSGGSLAQAALMTVNRIRYVRKHQSARYARFFQSVVVFHELLRIHKPGHFRTLGMVVDEQRWDSLPSGTQSLQEDQPFPSGCVIIPAHNEASVIARTLHPLAPLAASGAIEVIVACNGCSDETAQIAQAFEGVTVLETEVASKVAALNLAESQASKFPRLYLDADITITPGAVRMCFENLSQPDAVAARPAFTYDTAAASPLVQAFYRARRRIPGTNQALWGAGAYALSEHGRERFGAFPDLTADDLFVDLQYSSHEKHILPSIPVKVRTPRTSGSLLAILTRNYRGQHELRQLPEGSMLKEDTRSTARQLADTIADPLSALDALVYAGFVAFARIKARRLKGVKRLWESDRSSR